MPGPSFYSVCALPSPWPVSAHSGDDRLTGARARRKRLSQEPAIGFNPGKSATATSNSPDRYAGAVAWRNQAASRLFRGARVGRSIANASEAPAGVLHSALKAQSLGWLRTLRCDQPHRFPRESRCMEKRRRRVGQAFPCPITVGRLCRRRLSIVTSGIGQRQGCMAPPICSAKRFLHALLRSRLAVL